MAYPITRQFGPNAKGSELTFTDMDNNLLYLDSKVTGSSNYIPMYSGSTYLTSSIMYQLSGKIGIGTTNPYTLFNVVGITTIGYPGVSSNSYIQFWPNTSGDSAYYITDSGSVLRIGTGEKASSGTDVINIASTNVGIGTDNPQAKFVVSNNGAQGMEFGYSAALTSSYVESYNRSSSAAADMTYYIGPGTGSHRFYTGGAERVRIDKDGYVGINKNNPTAPLDIVGTTIVTGSAFINGGSLNIINSYPRLFLTDTDSDSDFSLINDNGNFTIYDDTNTAPRIYILSGGNVGINKFAPNAALDVNGNTTVSGSLIVSGTFTTRGFSATISGSLINKPISTVSRTAPHIRLDYTASSGLAIDNPIGIIASYVPEYNQPASYIKFVSQGTWSGGTYPSGIEFYTSQQSGGTEKLTLSLNQNGNIEFNNYGNGNVTTTGGNGTISVTSDKNLKTADGFIENGIEKVMALKPRYFYWKSTTGFGNTRQLGFYAQEVNAISEEAANTPVSGQQWGIYDRALIAILTKAVQEQQAQIETLQQQVNTLISGSI